MEVGQEVCKRCSPQQTLASAGSFRRPLHCGRLSPQQPQLRQHAPASKAKVTPLSGYQSRSTQDLCPIPPITTPTCIRSKVRIHPGATNFHLQSHSCQKERPFPPCLSSRTPPWTPKQPKMPSSIGGKNPRGFAVPRSPPLEHTG